MSRMILSLLRQRLKARITTCRPMWVVAESHGRFATETNNKPKIENIHNSQFLTDAHKIALEEVVEVCCMTSR